MTLAVKEDLSPALCAQPVALRLSQCKRMLEIEWPGGTIIVFRSAALRQGCRCAECVAQRRRGEILSVPPDVSLTDIVPFGPSAVRLTFSDGHGRGIFPFQYLRELSEQEASLTVS